MPRLLNQFDLKPSVELEVFEQAWSNFVDVLITSGLAEKGAPLCQRIPSSGYDTDEMRHHTLMAVIEFRDQAQADRAWEAIEDRIEPLGQSHRKVISLVHDPVFTFWAEL